MYRIDLNRQTDQGSRTKIDFNHACEVVAMAWGHDLSEVMARCRRKDLILPRHLSMYIGYRHCRMTGEQVGLTFGGRDHSTVVSSCRVVENMWRYNKDYRAKVRGILPLIGIREEVFV